MNGWLSYSAAFACASGAAALCYMAAFSVIMSSHGFGIAGMIALLLVMPITAGLVTIGAAYFAFAKRSFSIQEWAQGGAMVLLVPAMCLVLAVARAISEVWATILFLTTLFVGGRLMIKRASCD